METIPLETLWDEFASRGVKPMKLPALAGGDLDLALRSPFDLSHAQEAIAAFAGKLGAEVIRVVRRYGLTEVKLLRTTVPACAVIHLRSGGEGWCGPLYLRAEELFGNATEREKWFEPARSHQAMIVLCRHLLPEGRYREEYRELLEQWIAEDREAFSRSVANAFGPDWGERVVGMIWKRDVRALEDAVGKLRGSLWRHRGVSDLRGSLSRLLRFLAAEFLVTLSRQGRWIVLVGPDGVGKTSIAGGLAAETIPFFLGFRYHHWVPRWDQPLDLTVPPGGGRFVPRPPRPGFLGRLLSFLRLLRNLGLSWAAYALRVLPSLLRQRLVLGDRYLFNYVIDPESVRYAASPLWARWAIRMAPRPDLVVSLTGDPEAIHRRKAELTPPEIARRMERARSLGEIGLRMVEVDTMPPLEVVRERVALVVMETLR